TTVVASGTVQESTGAVGLAALAIEVRMRPCLTKRSQVIFRSSTSTVRPLTGALLCHFTPGLSLNVIVSLSGETSQLWRRSGRQSFAAGKPTHSGVAL